MEKINIAKILKDCPTGMKLNCTMYEDVEFDFIDDTPEVVYPIHCLIKTNVGYESLLLTSDGCINRHSNAKCVIFPKNKNSWKEFRRPFKDGDIVYIVTKHNNEFIAIFKDDQNVYLETYIDVAIVTSRYSLDSTFDIDNIKKQRLATEKEKQKLFKVIKEQGYKWNENTKTLEELIELKFKVGNKVVQKNSKKEIKVINSILDNGYNLFGGGEILFSEQDNWELVNNKFDISTLVPFESKVLARDYLNKIWRPAIWGFYNNRFTDYPYFTVGGTMYKMVIPYEGNEHLMGTTNDCKDYYKTWKE